MKDGVTLLGAILESARMYNLYTYVLSCMQKYWSRSSIFRYHHFLYFFSTTSHSDKMHSIHNKSTHLHIITRAKILITMKYFSVSILTYYHISRFYVFYVFIFPSLSLYSHICHIRSHIQHYAHICTCVILNQIKSPTVLCLFYSGNNCMDSISISCVAAKVGRHSLKLKLHIVFGGDIVAISVEDF